MHDDNGDDYYHQRWCLYKMIIIIKIYNESTAPAEAPAAATAGNNWGKTFILFSEENIKLQNTNHH